MFATHEDFTAHVAERIAESLRTNQFVTGVRTSSYDGAYTQRLTVDLKISPATHAVRSPHTAVAYVQLTCDYDPETLAGSVHLAFSSVWPTQMFGAGLRSLAEAHPELSITVYGEDTSVRRAVRTVSNHTHQLLSDGMQTYARAVDGELYDWGEVIDDMPAMTSQKLPNWRDALRGLGPRR